MGWSNTCIMHILRRREWILASFNLLVLGNIFVIKWIITLLRVMHQNFEFFLGIFILKVIKTSVAFSHGKTVIQKRKCILVSYNFFYMTKRKEGREKRYKNRWQEVKR